MTQCVRMHMRVSYIYRLLLYWCRVLVGVLAMRDVMQLIAGLHITLPGSFFTTSWPCSPVSMVSSQWLAIAGVLPHLMHAYTMHIPSFIQLTFSLSSIHFVPSLFAPLSLSLSLSLSPSLSTSQELEEWMPMKYTRNISRIRTIFIWMQLV